MMAHFAELDAEDVVLRVVVIANADITVNGAEDESAGIARCQALFGEGTRWAQTSYNGRLRLRYAGEGYWLDRRNDVFIPPKPYESWLLDESCWDWVAPVAAPEDGAAYIWNETSRAWVRAQREGA